MFTVLLLIYFCNQSVTSEIRHSRRDCSVCQQSTSTKRRRQDFDKKSLYLKGYTTNRLTDEFPEKSWTKNGVNKLLKKLRDTGTVDRRPVSSRPHSACTEENAETVNDLVLSQQDKLQTLSRHIWYMEKLLGWWMENSCWVVYLKEIVKIGWPTGC